MRMEEKDDIVIIKPDLSAIDTLLEDLNQRLSELSGFNLIIDLLECTEDSTVLISSLETISNRHKNNQRSFVITASEYNLDSIPEELMVVPTMQEAYDVIEMESIERNLGLI